jgi:tRNA (mo5U34)-methyltransferase
MTEPALLSMDIKELKERALEFAHELDAVKVGLAPPEFWYPYGTLWNVHHFDAMLTDERRMPLALAGDETVADIGGADGDLSFFLERFGCQVQLIDNGPTNYNGLRGARMLRDALGSTVEIVDLDLDQQFALPSTRYGMVFS